jgi:perosamine synthetase
LKNEFIPLSVPNITGNELEYVTEAVKTQWVSTAGGSIIEFEKQFSQYLNVKKACACQSGTAGLHLCLHHFGIGAGDIVLVPTLTFIATINAVIYQNATPVFFDCDDHLCINVEQVRKYLETQCEFDGKTVREKKSGLTVKAIIPVHIFGDVCDMDSIMDLSKTYGLIVIEDATESLGTVMPSGRYAGQHSGTIGHAGVFSFNGNKIITTGGGGMIVSNDEASLDHMRYLSQQSKDDVVYFVHNEVGFNYRMTNLQAALGLGQLEQLSQFVQTKKDNYAYYQSLLQDCSYATLLPFGSGSCSNHWFYSLLLNQPDAKMRDELIQHLTQQNIQARPVWKLNHTQKPFCSYHAVDCNKAQNFYDRIVNIPCSTNLTKVQIERVCETILSFR